MKSFFDTSVLVATFLENHEHHERSFALFEDAHRRNACCGAHSLAEIYATLTRLPGKFRLGTDQVLLFIELIEERLEIVSLDTREYAAAIKAAAAVGIVGGTIYDALLGQCALKARATKIYTWNAAHFMMLGTQISEKVQTP